MRAIYYQHFKHRPEVSEVEIPQISAHGVLVQVVAAGICRSDWHGWMGHDPDIRLPHVPGHEFSGVVVQIGSEVRQWKVGDRITTPFVQACGSCRYCRAGDHQVCEHQEQAGFTHWGAFAEYVEVRHADINLVAVPKHMSMEVAATLGCRFGTAYRAVIAQGSLKDGEHMVVFGCGGVGLSAIMIGKALGAHVVAVDVNAKARQLALSIGASQSVAPTELAGLGKTGFDLSIDAVGHRDIIRLSLPLLRRRGRHVQVGLLSDAADWHIDASRVVADELEIIGSHGIQSFTYPPMIEFIDRHQIPIELLIRQRCNLEDAIDKMISMDEDKHHGVHVITAFT